MYKISDFTEFIESLNHDSVGVLIGNFDGVHAGHQKLIGNFIAKCRDLACEPVIITFTPHPKFYFNPGLTDFLITENSQKLECIKKIGVHTVFECEFNDSVQTLGTEEFFQKYLLLSPKLKMIYLGHDFKLGKGKKDGVSFAKKICIEKRIVLCQENSITVEEDVVSSSLIRSTIKTDIVRANKLLGRPFCVKGRVIRGKGIGKEEFVPTANIKWNNEIIQPQYGVYVGEALVDGVIKQAVLNFGLNPTTDSDCNVKLEVYFLFESLNVYGKEIEVKFLSFLRGEEKFDNFSNLKSAIEHDVINAKKYFREKSNIHLALIGKNISHSKSQLMYEDLLKQAVNYDLLDYESPDNLPSLLELKKRYLGVSITAPYKKHYLEMGTVINSKIPAINCIVFKEGSTELHNTDYLAALEILNGFQIDTETTVSVLGDGAMGQLMEKVCEELKLPFKTYSRKKKNLSNINRDLSNNKNNLIVNCISRDYIYNFPGELKGIFWDLNYSHPEQAEKIKKTKLEYIDGLELLYLQAKYALNNWNLDP